MVKFASETLCITKCSNYRILVSFVVRRYIRGHSELETQMVSNKAKTRTKAFGVLFSWSFWSTALASLDDPFKRDVVNFFSIKGEIVNNLGFEAMVTVVVTQFCQVAIKDT